VGNTSGQINHDTTEANALAIGLSVFATILFVAAVYIFAVFLFRGTISSELNRKERVEANPLFLQNVRAEEEKLLNHYRKLDNGKYQIPVEAAMQKVVKEYSR
jgi:hypothetical protein